MQSRKGSRKGAKKSLNFPLRLRVNFGALRETLLSLQYYLRDRVFARM